MKHKETLPRHSGRGEPTPKSCPLTVSTFTFTQTRLMDEGDNDGDGDGDRIKIPMPEFAKHFFPSFQAMQY